MKSFDEGNLRKSISIIWITEFSCDKFIMFWMHFMLMLDSIVCYLSVFEYFSLFIFICEMDTNIISGNLETFYRKIVLINLKNEERKKQQKFRISEFRLFVSDSDCWFTGSTWNNQIKCASICFCMSMFASDVYLALVCCMCLFQYLYIDA